MLDFSLLQGAAFVIEAVCEELEVCSDEVFDADFGFCVLDHYLGSIVGGYDDSHAQRSLLVLVVKLMTFDVGVVQVLLIIMTLLVVVVVTVLSQHC